jgi:hypothetical protein
MRDRWRFPYIASQLLPYARKKEAFHRARITHWSHEWDKARAEATARSRDNLQCVEEATPDDTSYYNAQQSMNLDEQAALARVSLAERKIKSHKADADAAARYVRALSLHLDRMLYLDVDDLDYLRIGYKDDHKDEEDA